MARYALSWWQRNEIGEFELRDCEITPEEARWLIESKEDYEVALAKLMAEKRDD
jgi:hypothetical protein